MKLLIPLAVLLSISAAPPHASGQECFNGFCPGAYAPAQSQERLLFPYGRQQASMQFSAVCPQCELARGQGQGFAIGGQYTAEALSEQGEGRLEVIVDNPQAVIAGAAPFVTVYQVRHGIFTPLKRFVPQR